MAEDRERRVCATCGRRTYCDEHHPLGRAHASEITVPVCGECHKVLGERHAYGGVILDHNVARGEAEDLWALARGLGDLLMLLAWRAETLGVEQARRDEALTLALGRLGDAIFCHCGEPGIEGPNPRRNDLRKAGRRGKRVRDHSVPWRKPPRADPSSDLERVVALAGAVAAGLARMPQLPPVVSITAAAQTLAGALPRIASLLGELERRGRTDNLRHLPAVGRDISNDARHALDQTALGYEDWHRLPALGRLDALLDHVLEFVGELARAADGEGAEQALDRLLDRLRELR